MDHPLHLVHEMILEGRLQQAILGELARWPLLHFSDHAESILKEGFRRGEANPGSLDMTCENSGQPKPHPGPGYNFAFNAISWKA